MSLSFRRAHAKQSIPLCFVQETWRAAPLVLESQGAGAPGLWLARQDGHTQGIQAPSGPPPPLPGPQRRGELCFFL